jgi:uncharacterized protein YijF (DUF1287 family)
MADLKVGDLVQWKSGQASRAGVIKKIKPDGTCVVSRQGKGKAEEVVLRASRLERITSTVEPEA